MISCWSTVVHITYQMLHGEELEDWHDERRKRERQTTNEKQPIAQTDGQRTMQ